MLVKKIWSFSGGKGGSGKTFIVSSIAILMAREGHDVVLVDANTGLANAHTALGIKKPSTSLSNFALGKNDSIESIIHETPIENLRLISGDCDQFVASDLNTSMMSRLTERLRDVECDYLLIDTGTGFSVNAIDLFLMADVGALVTTPEPSSIELTNRFIKTVAHRKLIKKASSKLMIDHINEEMVGSDSGNIIEIVKRIKARISKTDKATAKKICEAFAELDLRLIINMVKGRKDQAVGPAMCEIIKKFYGFDLGFPAYIPYDETVSGATEQQDPFVIRSDKSDTAACLGLVMKSVIDSGEKVASDGNVNSPPQKQLDLIRS